VWLRVIAKRQYNPVQLFIVHVSVSVPCSLLILQCLILCPPTTNTNPVVIVPDLADGSSSHFEKENS